jgi:hypothetical protein
MRAVRVACVAILGIAFAAGSTGAFAYFQLASPYRFTFDGTSIRFDEVSIAETVVPCTRTRARLKLQVRATPKPAEPGGDRGHLLVEQHLGDVGPAKFGCPYQAFNVALKVNPPPPGTYYLSVFVFAFPSSGDKWCIDWTYCLEDWRGFAEPVAFGAAAPAPAR